MADTEFDIVFPPTKTPGTHTLNAETLFIKDKKRNYDL